MSKHNEVVLLEARLSEVRTNVHPGLSDDLLFQRDAVDTIMRQHDLTYDELDDGTVDGPNDGGIDAVFIILNDELVADESALRLVEKPRIELHILQVKNEGGFGEVALQLLIDHLPLLTSLSANDEDLRTEFNEPVVDRFALFRAVYLLHATRMPELSIKVTYASKATQAPNKKVMLKEARLKKVLLADFSSANADVEFLGAPELNAKARTRQLQVHSLPLAEQPLSTSLGGMVTLVRLADYVDFIRDASGSIRESMFEENVRGYEGNTNINKGIAASLKDAGNGIDFWWLNNGITILGNRVEYAHKTAQIEDPQVVNGLQTSRAVFSHFGSGLGDPNDKRHVLVRIINATDDAIAAQIIKATNSQNRVPAASLRAAEPFQRSIEDYFAARGRFYERRRNHYKNQGKKRSDIISVSELAQAVASIVLAQPDQARGRPGSLIRDPIYPKVFNDKMPLEFFWRCIQLMGAIEKFLVNDRKLGRSDRSNIRYHLARASVAIAVASSRPKPATVVRIDAGELEKHLGVVYDWLLGERTKVATAIGATDIGTIAKSAEFAAHLNSRLSKYSAKQKWPKMLHSGWAVSKSTP